jgi:hypothetical protein
MLCFSGACGAAIANIVINNNNERNKLLYL